MVNALEFYCDDGHIRSAHTPRQLYDAIGAILESGDASKVALIDGHTQARTGNFPIYLLAVQDAAVKIRAAYLLADGVCLPPAPTSNDVVDYQNWCIEAERCSNTQPAAGGNAKGEDRQTSAGHSPSGNTLSGEGSAHKDALPSPREVTAERHDIFICHASEDKIAFVDPLARALVKEGVSIFYDSMSIGWGDSLRAKIDAGLRDCQYGIVVLSKAFFGKQWPQRELDGLAERQIVEGRTVILPIWHEVDENDVAKFSPPLATCRAIRSTDGVATIVGRVREILRQ